MPSPRQRARDIFATLYLLYHQLLEPRSGRSRLARIVAKLWLAYNLCEYNLGNACDNMSH
jgi:beta-N-acetylglucosaminidase